VGPETFKKVENVIKEIEFLMLRASAASSG
jgi:hypothetical protein